jgi:hypothetical protein
LVEEVIDLYKIINRRLSDLGNMLLRSWPNDTKVLANGINLIVENFRSIHMHCRMSNVLPPRSSLLMSI